MTVEEIFQDRTKFSEAVYKIAYGVRLIAIHDCLRQCVGRIFATWASPLSATPSRTSLIRMGVLRLHEIKLCLTSMHRYLLALGAKRTAEVQRDARIGEAQARQESGIRVRSHSAHIASPHLLT